MIVNLDGQFIAPDQATLPLNDGAVLFGDTLFETIKVRHGALLRVDAHLDRIEMSAALLDFPCDRSAIATFLQETAKRLPWPVARLRLTLSRGCGTGLQAPPPDKARVMITANAYHEPDQTEYSKGIRCVFAPNRRVNPLSHLPQMKRGNYADCLYAARFAQAKAAREALFRSDDGSVLEGATSNLFMLKGNTLTTPVAGELVLAGVMRRQVMDTAPELGLTVREGPISMQALLQADEAFLTNALIEVLPIGHIEATPVKTGVISTALLQAVRDCGAGK